MTHVNGEYGSPDYDFISIADWAAFNARFCHLIDGPRTNFARWLFWREHDAALSRLPGPLAEC
jgi:hypothetical protein